MDNTQQEQTYVDLSSMNVGNEDLGADYNPAANPFAAPPPPPELKGGYTCTLAFASKDPSQRWVEKKYNDKDGKYLATRLACRILQPDDFTGRVFFDDFASTGVWQGGASKIQGIVHALGFKDELATCTSHRDVAALLERAISGGEQVQVRFRWTLRTKNPDTGLYETVLKGMDQFPTNPDGTYMATVKNPFWTEENGEPEFLTAKLDILSYTAAKKQAGAVG